MVHRRRNLIVWSLLVAVGRCWWPEDSCAESMFESQMMDRGLYDAEVAAVRDMGLEAVDDLLKSWSPETAHVVFLGDSLMHQLYKVIYCGAVARFCHDLEESATKAPTLVHINGSMTKGGEADVDISPDRAMTDEVASILIERRLSCGDEGRRVTLTHLQWYMLVDDSNVR